MSNELVERLRAYNDESFVETLCGEAADRIEQLKAQNMRLSGMCYDLNADIQLLQEALQKIVSCETPYANATVARMAEIGRTALKEEIT